MAFFFRRRVEKVLSHETGLHALFRRVSCFRGCGWAVFFGIGRRFVGAKPKRKNVSKCEGMMDLLVFSHVVVDFRTFWHRVLSERPHNFSSSNTPYPRAHAPIAAPKQPQTTIKRRALQHFSIACISEHVRKYQHNQHNTLAPTQHCTNIITTN